MDEVRQNGEQSKQSTPELLPEVGACYGHAWHRLWEYFPTLLLILIISIILQIPQIIPVLGYIYQLLVGLPIAWGFTFVCLKAARNEEPSIADLFYGFKNYGNVLLAYLLVTLIVIGGCILLIVPGIIFACKLAFVPYLVVGNKMGAIAAIKKSWSMTTGYATKVFLIWLMGIPIAIAGIICLIVGVIPAIMWINIAVASLYYSVCKISESAQKTNPEN